MIAEPFLSFFFLENQSLIQFFEKVFLEKFSGGFTSTKLVF